MSVRPDLYMRAVKALARMRIPDFSDVDGNTLVATFCGPSFDKDFLSSLCADIERESGGKVHLTRSDFDPEIMGYAARFIISDGRKEKKLCFGGYEPPFWFRDE